jgi:hypothetical protein
VYGKYFKEPTSLFTKEMGGGGFKWQKLAAPPGEWPLCDAKNGQGKNHQAIKPRGLVGLEVFPSSS